MYLCRDSTRAWSALSLLSRKMCVGMTTRENILLSIRVAGNWTLVLLVGLADCWLFTSSDWDNYWGLCPANIEKYPGYLFSELINHQQTAAYTERRILAVNIGENDGDGGLLHRRSQCEAGHQSGTAEVSEIEIERWQIYRGGLVTGLQVFRENIARKSNKIKYQGQELNILMKCDGEIPDSQSLHIWGILWCLSGQTGDWQVQTNLTWQTHLFCWRGAHRLTDYQIFNWIGRI